MVELDVQGQATGTTTQNLRVSDPPNYNITPPGPYVLFVLVVAGGIANDGQLVLYRWQRRSRRR